MHLLFNLYFIASTLVFLIPILSLIKGFNCSAFIMEHYFFPRTIKGQVMLNHFLVPSDRIIMLSIACNTVLRRGWLLMIDIHGTNDN